MTMTITTINFQGAAIERIQERYRRRTQWHKSEKTLTLQGKAICRRLCDGDKAEASALFDKIAKFPPEKIAAIIGRGRNVQLPADEELIATALDEVFPIIAARQIMNDNRELVEKELERLVYELPIMEWATSIKGVGAGSVAAILGNTGNLWNYATVQKLWKRMGMAVMPDGRRQRNLKGAKVGDPEAGGYNPQRRSVMWNVGTSIMFSQTARIDKTTGEIKRDAGPYRKIYDKRRAYEEEKNERGDYAELTQKILSSSVFGKTTEAYKAYTMGKLPKAHLKSRAQRYMEKEFLKQLWLAWRKYMVDAKPEREWTPPPPRPVAVRKPVRFGTPVDDAAPEVDAFDDGIEDDQEEVA